MKNWLRVSVLYGLFALTGSAVDWKALKPQGYVSDFANVIDPTSKTQLEAYARERGALHRRPDGAGHAPVAPGRADRGRRQHHLPRVGRRQEGQERRHPAAAGDSATGATAWKWATAWNRFCRTGLRARCCGRCGPRLRQQRYGEALMAAAETIGSTRRQGEACHNYYATAAARSQHSKRLDSVAAGHRRDLPADLPVASGRTARIWRRRRRRRRFPARADSG